jgi:ribosomal RNA-processing protein 9
LQRLVKKNKKLNPQDSVEPKRKGPKSKDDDEEISSEEDEVLHRNGYHNAKDFESEEELPETPQEKKLRLAKKYLEEIEKQGMYIHA